MALRILSDAQVKSLLVKTGAEDMPRFFKALGSAFKDYSIGNERKFQCHRQSVARPDGPTMLFMPSTLPDSSSVKVVGVPPPHASSKPISGVIVVCDEDGKAIGVINAAEITAFRTSLGSIMPYRYRRNTEHIVVFGAGKQALWHLRLALVLRGADIRTVTIVNRSSPRAEALIKRLREMDAEAGSQTTASVDFSIITDDEKDKNRLKPAVQQADIIFCTTPSTEPVFPAEWLTSGEGPQKNRFISAIGSYKLDMQEIDPELLRAIYTGNNKTLASAAYHPDKSEVSAGRGVILLDSREACAVEAGEVVKAEVPESHQLELGEVVHTQETGEPAAKEALETWLQEGLVIYKSVGMGIMDLSVSKALLELASSAGIGSKVDEF